MYSSSFLWNIQKCWDTGIVSAISFATVFCTSFFIHQVHTFSFNSTYYLHIIANDLWTYFLIPLYTAIGWYVTGILCKLNVNEFNKYIFTEKKNKKLFASPSSRYLPLHVSSLSSFARPFIVLWIQVMNKEADIGGCSVMQINRFAFFLF